MVLVHISVPMNPKRQHFGWEKDNNRMLIQNTKILVTFCVTKFESKSYSLRIIIRFYQHNFQISAEPCTKDVVGTRLLSNFISLISADI